MGLFYGAGYAHSLKPTFFLAQRQKTVFADDVPVQILDRELLRDLLTIPALNQDDEVVLRQDAARLFLWDQMAYLKKSGRRFLRFALRRCGLTDTDLESRKYHFETILSTQLPTYIHHEIGELKDQVLNRQVFLGFPEIYWNYIIRVGILFSHTISNAYRKKTCSALNISIIEMM